MAGIFSLTESILENPIFSGLEEKSAEDLAKHCEVLLLPPNRKVFQQGDEAQEMFVLFRGRLEIRVEDLAGEEHVVGTLSKGEVFGEMGVLDSTKRSASCYTAEDSVLLRIPGSGFSKMIKQGNPAVHRLLQFSLEKACSRLRSLDQRLDQIFAEDSKRKQG